MKKLILSSIMAGCLAASAQAVIIGASAGYLVDSEEAYLTARAGTEFNVSEAMAHAAELEIGYADVSEGSTKFTSMPVMINYRVTPVASGKLGTTLGAGVGMTQVKMSGWFGSSSDKSFSAQAFASMTYKATEAVNLTLTARYLWIGDAELFGISDKVGDDVSIEAGLSVKF